jgi:hypothetical protein
LLDHFASYYNTQIPDIMENATNQESVNTENLPVDNNHIEESKKVKIKRTLIFYAYIVLSFFFIWGIIHAIQTRTIEDFIKYSLYIAIPLAIIYGSIVFSGLLDTEGKNKLTHRLLLLPMIIFGSLFIGAMYYALAASLKDVYLWLRSPSVSRNGAIIITILITTVVAFILFYFRLKLRSIYGLTEAAIGLIVAVNRVVDSRTIGFNSNFYLIMLTASIYLIVRGFDDIHQGLTKSPVDPLGRNLYLIIRETLNSFADNFNFLDIMGSKSRRN